MAIDQGVEMHCSGADLYYLSALVNGELLLGVDDPFPGWLTEEITEEMPKARGRLEERGYLTGDGAETVTLGPGLLPLVTAMAMPDATLMLSSSTVAGVAPTETIYLSRRGSARLALTGGDRYRLAPLADAADLVAYIIRDRWALTNQPAAAGQPESLPEAMLIRAQSAATVNGVDATAQRLIRAGMSADTANALAGALANPVHNGAAVLLRRGELAWQTSGVAMLEGTGGLWRLRAFDRNGENWVEVIPVDVED